MEQKNITYGLFACFSIRTIFYGAILFLCAHNVITNLYILGTRLLNNLCICIWP